VAASNLAAALFLFSIDIFKKILYNIYRKGKGEIKNV